MKKAYEKPRFIPIELEANVIADCQFTNNWGWQVCPIVIPGLINPDDPSEPATVFSDLNLCTYTPDDGVSICDHAPDANSNTFGS